METNLTMRRELPQFYSNYFQPFFKPCPFPKLSNDPLSWNFQLWARVTSPDIIVSNGNVFFKAHKRVLVQDSSVLFAAIKGDRQCKVINFTNVSDEAMGFIYRCIYGRKDSPERNLTEQTISHELWKQLYMASRKYDLTIVSHSVGRVVLDIRSNLQRFLLMYDLVKAMEDTELIEDFCWQMYYASNELTPEEITSLPMDMLQAVLQLNANQAFQSIARRHWRGGLQPELREREPGFVFMGAVATYLRANPDKEVWHMLHDLYPSKEFLEIADGQNALVRYLAKKQSVLMSALLFTEKVKYPRNGVEVPNLNQALMHFF